MPAGSSAWREPASRRPTSRASMRPIGLDIGAVSPAEIAVSILGRDRRHAAPGPEAPSVKFGPVPVDEAVGALRGPSVRAGRGGREEGQPRSLEDALPPEAGRRRQHRRGAARGPETSARTRRRGVSRRPSRERMSASRGRSPAARTCSPTTAGVLLVDRAVVDTVNAVDEAITVATLPAYKPVVRGRDDRHRQDHSLRGPRSPAATGSRPRRGRTPRGTLRPPQGRRHLDHRARAEADGRRQDRRGAGSAPRARRRRRIRGGSRPARFRRASKGAGAIRRPGTRNSSWCSAPRPSRTGGTSFRRRSSRPEEPSSTSACRSIPATSCSSVRSGRSP